MSCGKKANEMRWECTWDVVVNKIENGNGECVKETTTRP